MQGCEAVPFAARITNTLQGARVTPSEAPTNADTVVEKAERAAGERSCVRDMPLSATLPFRWKPVAAVSSAAMLGLLLGLLLGLWLGLRSTDVDSIESQELCWDTLKKSTYKLTDHTPGRHIQEIDKAANRLGRTKHAQQAHGHTRAQVHTQKKHTHTDMTHTDMTTQT